jgi:hypothetical protein
MLGYLPRRFGARALAALVVLVISGAPRLAVAVRTGTVHVCQCRAHGDGHRCACPVCAEQARRARRGAIADLPPCCQRRALLELEEEEERERSGRGVPTLKPTCGFDDPVGTPLPPVPTFVLPGSVSPAPPRRAEPLARASAEVRETPAVPDVPPPIAGR